ncbi:MAG TPA: glycosyltransferase [Capsulimonadaceae bacterium]|nr:glycosyltransferase [Capsulimonadaceae bacterium]
MKISIVTPAYNAAGFLGATLESVLAQTFTDWEQVLVDDGSSDGTYEIATRYAARDSRVRVVQKPNGGVATARNFGYERISPDSEYVIFLDHDDTWKPDALERLLKALEADPKAVAAHALARQTDLDGNPTGAPGGTIYSYERRKVVGTKIEICSRAEPTTFACMICDCAISTPGVTLIRRSAFEKINRGDGIYFDQAVASGDDWDVWIRLSLRGDFVFVDDVLLNWRQHGDNGSVTEHVTFASESRVRQKMVNWPEFNPEQRRMAQWRYRRRYASIERGNASACWHWAWESARHREWGKTLRLTRTTLERYAYYLGLRHFWNLRRKPPTPLRLVDVRQVLDT